MSYSDSARVSQLPEARPVGRITSQANDALSRQEAINSRLARILANARRAPPHEVGKATAPVAQHRPTVELLDSLSIEQDTTFSALDELEGLI